ncbi:MAG: EAL domain-containing protein [Atopobiaceae bacterium]|nr:EAL domain-containing protein [Atopobiaceae bacterium]
MQNSPSVLEDKKSRNLSGDDVSDWDEVARQNRAAIRYFATTGLPISAVNLCAQSLVQGAPDLMSNSILLLAYFVLLFFAERFFIPERFKYSTLLVYLVEAPVMVMTILQGTLWDPTHQAVTFLMFMLAVPVFILDSPFRVIGVTLGWSLLFVMLCLVTKDEAVVRLDVLHVLEYFLLSVAVTYTVLQLRFAMVASLQSANYNLQHDTLTGALNRSSLESRFNRYVGKPAFVAMGDIDRLTLIEDYYGAEAGHAVLCGFSSILKDVFGIGNTYRYGGDEFICIVRDVDEEDALRMVEECRSRFLELQIDGLPSALSSSFGYATGVPADEEQVRQMVQLANIYAHMVRQKGSTHILGGPCDASTLREGMVESSVNSHARAYEVNQLTGLPSMSYFTMRSEELLHSVADFARRPVVCYLKSGNFREFNETYGYAQGDELIRTMAHLLKEVLPNRHITYISGSRFGALVYFDEVETAMSHLTDGLNKVLQGKSSAVVKAGVAEWHEGDSVISLLDKARVAYDSVADQPDTLWRLYDQELDARIRMRRHLVAHLDQALDEGWVKVHYQPIVDARTGRLANLEALSRWLDPLYGLLPPFQFIGVLEDEGLLHKLSLYVVRQALADLTYLRERGFAIVPVSVNLSRKDFAECDMVAEIGALVDESGLSRDFIKIEITESAFMDTPELLTREVDRFREQGFEVWMDDFGSEYSTLNSLEELTFDLIKLDMRFMRNFVEGSRSATIVASILDMCHRLHITTLTEGVETPEQRDALCEMGCERLQGYLFSPPRQLQDLMSIAEAKGWMA